MQPEVFVINESSKRERGDSARAGNASASILTADVIRSTLGPSAMLKMVLDPAGGVVMTNDGNAILREIDVAHPAAKALIELARGQSEQCGDGTCGAVVLAGEVISACNQLVQKMHPIVLTENLQLCLETLKNNLKPIELPVNEKNTLQVIQSALGTKFSSIWSDLIMKLAYQAIQIVKNQQLYHNASDIDIKRYARVEKIPGGAVSDTKLIRGCVINKDLIHPKMPKSIQNPRILLLDASLEYKKANSMLNVELQTGASLSSLLDVENDYLNKVTDHLLTFTPNIIITEKGVSDIVAQRLADVGVACLRRVRKTDNLRLAAATGAQICNEIFEISANSVGSAGSFSLEKFGDEFFVFVENCGEKCAACTILLRGASKDNLLEIERNLQTAMQCARNFTLSGKVVVGGGAFEMEISRILRQKSLEMEGLGGSVFRAVGDAFEVVPRTLLMNCGGNIVRCVAELRGDLSGKKGVDGVNGGIVDCQVLDLFDVKMQQVSSVLEHASMIMRVDDLINCKRD